MNTMTTPQGTSTNNNADGDKNSNTAESSNFLTNATSAMQRISTLTPGEIIAKSFTDDDTVKIDTAIKAYMSLVVARDMTISDTDDTATNTESNCNKLHLSTKDALACARVLLKAINSFVVPPPPKYGDLGAIEEGEEEVPDDTHKDDEEKVESAVMTDSKEEKELKELEYKVLRMIWNGVVEASTRQTPQSGSKQIIVKPSKVFGNKALKLIYPEIVKVIKTQQQSNSNNNQIYPKETMEFVDDFGALLLNYRRNDDNSSKDNKEKNGDNDSELIWSPDRGQAELARRMEKRKKDAEERENREKANLALVSK